MRLERSQVQLPAEPLSGNDLGQVVHTRTSVTKQYNLVPVAISDVLRLGRSGVALTMHHRLKWFIHLRSQGLSKGDEHPTNTPHGEWY